MILLHCEKTLKSSFIIIDPSAYAMSLSDRVESMGDFVNSAICETRESGLDKILEYKPDLVFLSVEGIDDAFALVGEIIEYLDISPTIIMISDSMEFAYEAYQRGISGYLLKPINTELLRKCLFRYQKNRTPKVASKKISIRSQGDHHFIKTDEILYLKADNNTTDFFLEGGRMITAYKTLKHFDHLLPVNFYRIHHSYIINSDCVSRINLTKGDCYLNTSIILPFSRTYKLNIDSIISKITD